MLRKADRRKALIALAVKEETTVSLQWLSDRLRMGARAGVSRYTSWIAQQAKTGRKLAKQLAALRKDANP